MNPVPRLKCQPRFEILNTEQIEEIHRASLQILETIGVKVLDEEAVRLLRKAGCRVKDNNVVQIPNGLVNECIDSVPSSITIYNRLGEEAMHLEGRNSYFGLGTDLLKTYDLNTHALRLSCLKDVANAARVADYCEDIDFLASFALASDRPANTMYVDSMKTMLENSTKPIFFTAASADDLSLIIQMAEVVAGGEQALRSKPFVIHYSEPTPPLRHSQSAVRKLFFCAERNIPICYTPGSTIGGTAPVTLAGAIVQANAESLSGIVMHQLKKKGAPIISGLGGLPLDMRTSVCAYGAPASRLLISASAGLYHHYNIPAWSTLGSDALCLDGQAAMEHTFGILMAALDGANLIHDAGYLGQGLLGNPAMIVMSDEIISYAKKILDGFILDPNRMGLDVIAKVAEAGGSYIAEKHTVQYCREGFWKPRNINRDGFEEWVHKGSKNYEEVLSEKTLEILENHRPKCLDEDVSRALTDILLYAKTTLSDVSFKV